MREAISGHQWSSVVISGSQWHSVALSGPQWHSVALSGTHLPTIMPFKRYVGIHTYAKVILHDDLTGGSTRVTPSVTPRVTPALGSSDQAFGHLALGHALGDALGEALGHARAWWRDCCVLKGHLMRNVIQRHSGALKGVLQSRLRRPRGIRRASRGSSVVISSHRRSSEVLRGPQGSPEVISTPPNDRAVPLEQSQPPRGD